MIVVHGCRSGLAQSTLASLTSKELCPLLGTYTVATHQLLEFLIWTAVKTKTLRWMIYRARLAAVVANYVSGWMDDWMRSELLPSEWRWLPGKPSSLTTSVRTIPLPLNVPSAANCQELAAPFTAPGDTPGLFRLGFALERQGRLPCRVRQLIESGNGSLMSSDDLSNIRELILRGQVSVVYLFFELIETFSRQILDLLQLLDEL
jgi:hypothetical protein